jgi:flavin-dependent dehydrogenase
LEVAVVEKKASAGEKLHTTGIIVKDAVDTVDWLRDVPPALVRRIEGVRLYAPSMRSVDLFAPGYYFWATDSPALLDWMVDSLRTLGVQVRLGTLFERAQRTSNGWRVPLSSGEEIEAAYLVGADGPHSRVAKVAGLSSNQHFLFGIEYEYAPLPIAENFLHCFIDRRLAPGYIGWALAGVNVTQVGLARRIPHGSVAGSRELAIDAFRAKIASVVETGAVEPTAVRAGMIPCGGVVHRVATDRAMLVGDAAGMVSPVTAGGIHTALRHGAQVGSAVAEFIRGDRPDPAHWLAASYPRFRKKRLLRWLFDHAQSDWVFDRMLSTPLMRRAAELVYFHRKGG